MPLDGIEDVPPGRNSPDTLAPRAPFSAGSTIRIGLLPGADGVVVDAVDPEDNPADMLVLIPLALIPLLLSAAGCQPDVFAIVGVAAAPMATAPLVLSGRSSPGAVPAAEVGCPPLANCGNDIPPGGPYAGRVPPATADGTLFGATPLIPAGPGLKFGGTEYGIAGGAVIGAAAGGGVAGIVVVAGGETIGGATVAGAVEEE